MPVYIERIVEILVERVIEVEKIVEVERIVEVAAEEKPAIEEKIVYVPVEKIV